MDFSSVYKKVNSSIVNVVVVNKTNVPISTGSGVLIGDGSTVLTCNHCIDSSNKNGIYFKGSGQFYQGVITFQDPSIDIAMIKLSEPMGTPSPLVSSSGLEIGNEVFTVGFPYTFPGEKTMTTGHIAAFDEIGIKINSSVNNGNSGGALFNTSGQIVGIVNAKLGALSDYLDSIEKQQPAAFMSIGGINPIEVIQKMITEMKRNLNLGIGYAVPTDLISKHSQFIQNIIS